MVLVSLFFVSSVAFECRLLFKFLRFGWFNGRGWRTQFLGGLLSNGGGRAGPFVHRAIGLLGGKWPATFCSGLLHGSWHKSNTAILDFQILQQARSSRAGPPAWLLIGRSRL